MKKMLMLILGMSLALSAAFVPVDRARTVAENQYNQYCADAAAKGVNVINVVENKYQGETTWYAFEFEQGGFVIVSADDAVRPVLGYSDHGKIPAADKPGGENFREWFGNYDKQIAYMREIGAVDKAGAEKWEQIEANNFSSSKATIVVDRLVRSEWDQVYPWNDQCPLDGGQPSYVGCVATAMAQVLRYHQWPDVGEGSRNGVDFTSHTWNYDLMPYIVDIEYGLYPEYWETGITQAEVDELARQSYWMGASVDMSWSAEGSGAYMTDVPTAFNSYWKASSSNRSTFSTPPAGGSDASFNTIKSELDAGRPWVWAGGVHAFILDGYRDDHWYHFNWGWAGSYDGWFHRSSLVPDGTGSGGGDEGDYTDGQEGVTYVPSTNTFTTWPATTLNGSVSNGCDVSLSWSSQSGATGYKVFRTKNNEGVPTHITTTTSLSYDEYGLPAGEYAYHIIVTYDTGESHNSNVYNASVTTVSEYKYPTATKATTAGRTAIDVSWAKPWFGIPVETQDFETGSLSPWELIASAEFTDGSNGWTADDGTRWYVEDGTVLGPEFIHDGSYSAGIGYSAGIDAPYHYSWLYSPQFTAENGSNFSFWVWYCNNAPEGSGEWPTDMYFVFYTGNFNESSGTAIAANTNIIEHWDGEQLIIDDPDYWGNNEYDEQVDFDLSAYAGQTGRIGIIYDYNDGYQAAVDDIIIGGPDPSAVEPDGYKVYRDGTLVTELTSGPDVTEWSDTGFNDGANEYFVKAVYPTGESIPSSYATAIMDANPKPYYLSGTFDEINTESNLEWYQPYKNPPMWYCYYDVTTSTTTIDMLDVACPKRRVKFATDAGFYYPVTIDSIGAYFYEWSDDPWSTDQFVMRVVALGFYAEGGGMLPDTVLWESGTLTATHNQMYKLELPTPITRTKGWAVEVEAAGTNTGHPGNLAGPSTTGSTHSYFYYSTEDSYDYYMIANGEPAEYAILTHLTSSDPPAIAKNSGWTGPEIAVPEGITKEDRDNVSMAELDHSRAARTVKGENYVKDPKALDTYYIYRNESYIGSTSNLYYTDSSPVAGDNTYYVTAVYTNPAGESEGSNEITLGPPPVIGVPASISEAVPFESTGNGSFNIANSGLGNLNYEIIYDYVGSLAPGGTYHSEDFASGQGSYTTSGGVTFDFASGYAYMEGAKGGATGVLTSPSFDTSGANELSLSFDETKAFNGGTASIDVEYYTGSAWENVYSSTNSGSGTKIIPLPTASASTQIRFTAWLDKAVGAGGFTDSYQVDNIVVSSDDVPYTWLNFTSTLEGTVISESSNAINYTIDTAGLTDGNTYDANITVISNDETSPNVIPMTLTVGGAPPVVPEVPTPVTTSVAADVLTVSWGQSADADIYDVYTSADPYGTFGLDGSTANLSYDYTIGTENKMFFYVIARNSTKQAAAPATIKIAKPEAR